MTISKLAGVLALTIACATFAGGAYAGEGKEKPGGDDGPGKSEQAPGQEGKVEAESEPASRPAQAGEPEPPAQQAQAPGRSEEQAEKKEARGEQAASKRQPAPKASERREPTPGSYKETSQGTDLKKGMDHKHTICHATGSSSNPYVVITPSVSGVFNGHLGHQGDEDIVPPFVYRGQAYSQNWDAQGQAIFAAGCRAPTPANTVPTTTTERMDCPTVKRTERVRVGWMHRTGNGKVVFVRASEHSAHGPEHGDAAVVEERTVVRATGEDCDERESTTTTLTTTVTTATTAAATTQAAVRAAATTTTTPPAGGVAGVQAVVPPPAEQAGGQGGVLGAQADLRAVGERTLPFTGVPLWLAALVGLGLLTAGLGLRRASRS